MVFSQNAIDVNKQKLKEHDRYILHVDGKQLKDIGKKGAKGGEYERIAMLCTASGEELLVAIPKLEDSKAPTQVSAIIKELDNFEIKQKIIGICYDNAPVNVGHEGGVGVLLEKELNRKLLKISCRHHFYELVLTEVFKKLFGKTSGEFVNGAAKFAKVWTKNELGNVPPSSAFDGDNLASEMMSESFARIMAGRLTALIDMGFARDDYKELIELTLIFLGERFQLNLNHLGQ